VTVAGHAGRPVPGAGWLQRRPEWPLAVVALGCWGLVLLTARPGHAGHSGASWLQLQGEWLLMVPAMMLLPSLPMARRVARNSLRRRRTRAVLLFGVASLAVWAGFGVAAVTAVHLLDLRSPLVLAGTLAAAAAWELTPSKRRFLRACHRMPALPPHGRKADRACADLGLRYGRSCFGACWALMLPMAIAGHSPGLMVLLTGVAAAEEIVVKGHRIAPVAAVLLLVASTMVLVAG
jgi:predicted metal-binding membrane protein